jgi:hypothetical protein
MFRLKLLFVFSSMLFLLSSGCTDDSREQGGAVFKQIPELKEIRPEKPVKIKLKRSTRGAYSWDLSGDNADKVLQADRKLRKALHPGSESD